MPSQSQGTVAVALSGGVDSLMTLSLLLEEGTACLGLHASFLPEDERSRRVRERLGDICGELQVPFHHVDCSRTFAEAIIRPFVQGYASGLTPNPCSLCNPRIKFGFLLDTALELGAKALATGHYARLAGQGAHPPALMRGRDAAKEQSYFLALVPPDRLARARFPLGELCKEEVKAAVQGRFGEAPSPGESQEICFVPGNDYRAFLERQALDLPGPGPMLGTDGTFFGEHQGLHRYTVGQRRGLGIAHSEPLYVLGKDAAGNALLVGPRRELTGSSCSLEAVNYLLPFPQWPEAVWVQCSYRQEPRRAEARQSESGLHLSWHEPAAPAVPGQIGAVYSAEGRVLAGGIIRGR